MNGKSIVFLSDINFQQVLHVDKKLEDYLKNKTVVANFEGYISDSANENTLAMSLENVEKMKHKLNIKYVSLANNHSMDGGYDEFKQTISLLKKLDITVFGTSDKPHTIIRMNEKKVGILAFAWRLTGAKSKKINICLFSLKKIVKQIEELKKKTDVVIVYAHWGTDLEILPQPWQIKAAKILKKNGVDFIIGHHPHIIQDYFDNVFFSIGNTVIPINKVTNYHNSLSENGLIVELIISNKGVIDTNVLATKSAERILKLSEKEEQNIVNIPSEIYSNYKKYISFYRKKRRKKIIPVFSGNLLEYLFKLPCVLFLEKMVSTKLGKSILEKRHKK